MTDKTYNRRDNVILDAATRRPGGDQIATLWLQCQSDSTLLCGCVAGADPVYQIEAWLTDAGFAEVRDSMLTKFGATVAAATSER